MLQRCPLDSYVTFVKKLLHCNAVVVDLLVFIVLCASRSVTVGLISFMLQRNGRYSPSSCSYSRSLLCFLINNYYSLVCKGG